MQTEIFTIADAATITAGKLSMLGSFDHLGSPSFPTTHSSCVVICKLRMDHEDSGRHELKLRIIDPDGHDVIPPAESLIEVEIDLDASGHHNHLWHIRGLPLPKPGVFYIDAIMDGSLLARTPLFVKQGSQP
jgi:hypothetical protein